MFRAARKLGKIEEGWNSVAISTSAFVYCYHVVPLLTGTWSSALGNANGLPEPGKQHSGINHQQVQPMTNHTFRGIVERTKRGEGFVRTLSRNMAPSEGDVYVSAEQMTRHRLREGNYISGIWRKNGQRNALAELQSINGLDPDAYASVGEWTTLTAIAPDKKIRVAAEDATTRIIDLITPLGFGQRALIVAPPRSGKTLMLQALAKAISANHPETELLMLLVDERPEEVTDMERSVRARVFASSNDMDFVSHERIARLTLEYAKRQAEAGNHIVILLDSLTRLGRTYNTGIRGSGRILSGGMDARALETPKRLFGASRCIEHGGSLTIIATILIDTGSRMDELIFQEFKGTGNCEIVLDRTLADLRIYPAIDIQLSGTRREELLLGKQTDVHQRLRRALLSVPNRDAVLKLVDLIGKTANNAELLNMFTG
jgi:transcription termination factor Rho